MVVYAEYLFAENFITGIIILYFTGRLCGCITSRIRMAAGGILCGFFSFTIFVRIPLPFPALTVKLVFSILVCGISFSFSALRRRGGWKLIPVFYIVSFLLGGITFAVLFLTGFSGAAGNGSLYLPMPTYACVILGIGVGTLAGTFLVRQIKNRVRSEKLQYEAVVEIGGRQLSFSAYTDTGNGLRDPFSHMPVSVITEEGANRIYKILSPQEQACRYCVIPFHAAGTENGTMDGIRADRMILNDGRSFSPVVLAVYRGNFRMRLGSGTEKYDILLNQEIVGGGLI